MLCGNFTNNTDFIHGLLFGCMASFLNLHKITAMKKLLSSFALFCIIYSISTADAQQTSPPVPLNARPKLVVGIVVDQMRWDYLYYYYDSFSNNGFKKLLKDGFSCENTFIPYTPTVTAVGHASIFTGSVPAIHGIVGNNWFEEKSTKSKYCVTDTAYYTIGNNLVEKDNSGQRSPRVLLTTTIGDELKIATNYKAKVVGVSIKDRSAILPAGHEANIAVWFSDASKKFITSSYYTKSAPVWLSSFNDAFCNNNQCDELKETSLYGNTVTKLLAERAIENYELGKDNITDMLTVSFSTPDLIGHAFGPFSKELNACYKQLDNELADFITYLDTKIGKNNYTLFLTADHGVAHVPDSINNEEHHIPAGYFSPLVKKLNQYLAEKYDTSFTKMIKGEENNQLYFNMAEIAKRKLNADVIINDAIVFLSKENGISRVMRYDNLESYTLNKTQKEMLTNGYYPSRCGEIIFINEPAWMDDIRKNIATTHGVWNPYDAHIPLLFYGYGINKGKTYDKTYMTDIAPTITSLLHIQMPSGCIGNIVKEVIKK